MTQDGGNDLTPSGGYDLTPDDKPMFPVGGNNPAAGGPAEGAGAAGGAGGAGGGGLKPGDPGWIPPTVIVEVEKKSDEPEEGAVDPDVEKFKGLAVLAYVFFLIPLIAAPNSKFARYHANQGLLTFILLMVVCFGVAMLYLATFVADHVLTSVPLLDDFFDFGFGLLRIAFLVGWVALVIAGIINAANGLKKELPVIGHWTLIK